MKDMGISELAAATATVSTMEGSFSLDSLEGTLVTLGTAGAAWLIRLLFGWLKKKVTKTA